MKKLLILLMAFSLFTACNNDKGKYSRDDKNSTNREKDDYSNKDDRSNDDKTSNNDKRSEEDKDTKDYTSSDGWTESDRNKALEGCMEGFDNNQQALAKKICPCAIAKFEKKYASFNEMNERSGEAEGKKIGKECAEEMNINTNNANKNNNDQDDYSSGGWTSANVLKFVKPCVKEAQKSGLEYLDANQRDATLEQDALKDTASHRSGSTRRSTAIGHPGKRR